MHLEEVERAYLAAAAGLHPDLNATGDDSGRAMAALNEGRRQLENPEARADVLLRRFGGPAAADERALPAPFLAEMMDVRQEIEAAMSDPADRPRARSHWESWARERRCEAIAEVSRMFSGVPAEGGLRDAALRRIRVRLNQWRYVERLIEQLDPNFDGRASL